MPVQPREVAPYLTRSEREAHIDELLEEAWANTLGLDAIADKAALDLIDYPDLDHYRLGDLRRAVAGAIRQEMGRLAWTDEDVANVGKEHGACETLSSFKSGEAS